MTTAAIAVLVVAFVVILRAASVFFDTRDAEKDAEKARDEEQKEWDDAARELACGRDASRNVEDGLAWGSAQSSQIFPRGRNSARDRPITRHDDERAGAIFR